MKQILIFLTLFICECTFAYQNKDFEEKYNELTKTMERSVVLSMVFETGDKSELTNLSCLTLLDKVKFLNFIIDNYKDYKEMLRNFDTTSPSKSEFEEMKAKHLAEIEDYKKALVGTEYNCTPK